MSSQKDSPPKRKHARTLSCRQCGAPLQPGSEGIGPFCSARCRMQDLSKWFNEGYKIAADPATTEPDRQDEEDS